MKRIRLAGAAALALSAALVLSACGDDDDDSDSGGGSDSSAPAPTGTPINIGFMNTENSPAGSYPDLRLGAEAAVKYVNEELGGVNGRPLDMETCILNGSGESSIECANRFVQSGKVAVSYGLDFGGTGSIPVFATAGVPLAGGLGTDPAQLTSPNSYLFVGGITGSIPSLSRYIGEDLKAAKVAILATDIPAAHLAVDTFSKPILAKHGVTDVNAVYESATAADYTPALTKANEGDPDVIFVLVGGASCSKVMQGTQTVGIPTSKMIYLQTCSAQDQLDAGGAGAQGILAQSPYLSPDSEDPQVQIYRDAMDAFDPDAPVGPNSQSGFSFIMDLVDIMKGIQGDITKESISAALKATVNQSNFMSHPYTCDGKLVPNLPAICNASERILRIEGGKFEDVKGDWIEGVSQLGP